MATCVNQSSLQFTRKLNWSKGLTVDEYHQCLVHVCVGGRGGKGIFSGRSRGESRGPHLPPSDLRVFSLLVGSQNYFREGLHLTTQLEV